jgi:hypothetical protein
MQNIGNKDLDMRANYELCRSASGNWALLWEKGADEPRALRQLGDGLIIDTRNTPMRILDLDDRFSREMADANAILGFEMDAANPEYARECKIPLIRAE